MTLGFRYHILWTHFQVKRYIADIEMHDNVVLTRLGLSASENPVGVQHMGIWNLYLRFQRMVYNFIAILQEFNGIKTEQ